MRGGSWHVARVLVLGAWVVAAPACAQVFGIGELDLQLPDGAAGSAGSAGTGGAFADAPWDQGLDQDASIPDTGQPEADAAQDDSAMDSPKETTVDASGDAVEESDCPSGTLWCSGACVSANINHCGSCGNDCVLQGAGFVCGGSGLPESLCSCSGDGSCNPHSTFGTCQSGGLCQCKNATCNRGEQCELDSGGKKDVCSCNGAAACGLGMTCCQSPAGCINLDTNAQSCGACGRACPPGFNCETGSCVCSDSASCNAGSAGTCTAKTCVCGSQTCTVGKRCLADGSCG